MIKSTGSRYRVLDDDGIIHECFLRGRFRVSGVRTTNPVAVGDRVTIDVTEGVITALSPRRNYIIRKASNLSRESQIIAANIDQAFLVITVKMPETPVEFIDRFLATAEAYRIPAVILINKTDLYGEEEMEMSNLIRRVYEKIGYRVLMISVTADENLSEVEENCAQNTPFRIGWKSTCQQLNPDFLKTGHISDYRTGSAT